MRSWDTLHVLDDHVLAAFRVDGEAVPQVRGPEGGWAAVEVESIVDSGARDRGEVRMAGGGRCRFSRIVQAASHE